MTSCLFKANELHFVDPKETFLTDIFLFFLCFSALNKHQFFFVSSVTIDQSSYASALALFQPSLIFAPVSGSFPSRTSPQENCLLKHKRKRSYVNIVFVYEAGQSQHNTSLCARGDHITLLLLAFFKFFFASLSLACPYMSPYSSNSVVPLSNILLWCGRMENGSFQKILCQFDGLTIICL